MENALIYTVGEAARILGRQLGRTIPPREISTLFYCQKLEAPMIGGRRIISGSYLPEVRRVLEEEQRRREERARHPRV
jgi:hypothetical protein